MTTTRKSPLARAMDAKREMWMWNDILDGLGRDPSHERDVAFDARADAAAEYRKHITTAWLYRLADRAKPLLTGVAA